MTRHGRLLAALKALSERELTDQVLLPLFSALGYDRVEYSGGPTEQGKDITCWRRDELDEIELTVVQVKLYKPARAAAVTRSIQTIINQLSQACEKALPHPESQQLHLPTTAYLVTPFPVDTLVLQSKFEALATLRRCRVRILDGPRLVDLLEKRLRPVAARLLGTTGLLADVTTRHLTNEILLRALDLVAVRSVHTFYTDIDLGIGQATGQLLFIAEYNPNPVFVSLSPTTWPDLRNLRDRILRASGADVWSDTEAQINNRFAALLESHERWRVGFSALTVAHRNATDFGRVCHARLEEIVTKKLRSTNHLALRLFPDTESLLRALRKKENLGTALHNRESQPPDSEAAQRIRELTSEIAALREKLGTADEILATPLHQLDAAEQAATTKGLALETWARENPEPPLRYEVTLTGTSLASFITAKRKELLTRLQALNVSLPTLHTLREFLLDVSRELARLEDIARCPELLTALGPCFTAEVDAPQPTVALNTGIQTILDTGLNLLILGEAGAGKTTSLQMYAYRKLVEDSSQQLVLYLPVAKLAKLLGATTNSPLNMLEGASVFLSNQGVQITPAELEQDLMRGGIVLIDGIDEALDRAPELLSELTALANRFPAAQWIVAARTSGRLRFDSRFTPITLLPFSVSQSRECVLKWFGAERETMARSVLAHLDSNDEVASVVRNPLLMTILCVLAEHGLPLPSSEVRLYKDRFDLLLGKYDLYKEVVRLRTRSDYLVSLAQRLAFRMHCELRRDADMFTLERWAAEVLEADIGRSGALRALEELIDPCNVLVPMSPDGKLGFGHLRYQEYLSARELSENRSVDVAPLLQEEWWSGALLLFAQMATSLSWLVTQDAQQNEGQEPAPLLFQMVEIGPPKEREGLLWILHQRRVRSR